MMTPAEQQGRRTRVLVLIKGLGIGGAERLLSEGSRFWNTDEFDYQVAYILPWKDQLTGDLAARGFDAVCIGDGWWPITAPIKLRRLVRATRPHLIHAHLPVAATIARLLGGAPVIYTEHSLAGAYRQPTRSLNRMTYGRNRAVIAVSEPVARSLDGYPGPAPQVIPNGVSVDDVVGARRRVRAELALEADSPLVVHVGNIRPQKGHGTLLRAAGEVREALPDTVFVSIGAEKHAGDLERARRDAQAEGGVVRYLGRRPDAIDFIAGADVLVNPSDVEGLPLVILEAMMAGTPVVATAVGGVPTVVRDGETGYLVPVGQPRALAAALTDAITHPDRTRAMAERARTIAERDYSLEAMVGRYEAIYRSVLNG